MRVAVLYAVLLGILVAVAGGARTVGREMSPGWAAPLLDDAVVVVETKSSRRITLEQCAAELAKADVAFLGEQHTDETTHRFELAVYERLLALKENNVVLSLEMFDRDVQPVLDRYLAGELAEAEFLAQTRPWSNYAEAYRPLIEKAKAAGAPVVAANYPASLRKRVALEGAGAIESFTPQERQATPREYLPSSPAYWKRVDNAVRGHAGMLPASSEEDRLYSTQSLWDNAMGEGCADALQRYPGSTVLQINGGFHSAYGEGVVQQMRQRRPGVRTATVAILPVANPRTERLVGLPSADYLALVEARASNLDEGKRTVASTKGISYLFHLPDGATADRPVPLLIWLVDDGLTAEDGMALCRELYGHVAAIAVIEPPYREMQPDLAAGGRWFWPESFAADVAVGVDAVANVWAYALRHFPIAAERVCVAGEGTGATVAAAAALHSDRMPAAAVAINPRQYAKLRDMPLPLPEYFKPGALPRRTLAVIGGAALEAWWAVEVAAYAKAEMPSRFITQVADPWQRERQWHDAIFESLQTTPPAPDAAMQREYLVLPDDAPRARHWARLQATWLSRERGTAVAVVEAAPDGAVDEVLSTHIRAEAASRPGALPACPGPFGGTTIVVLPEETLPEEADEWLAIERDDPLTRQSKFHRVRIAAGRGEPGLSTVLAKLNSEGRRNVLIVPAAFYAQPEWLLSLRRETKPLENEMTIHWSPGLGGRQGILTDQRRP